MYTPQQQAAHKAMRDQRKADQIRIKNYLRQGRPINPERMRNIRSAGTCVGGKVFQMTPGFNYRSVRNLKGFPPLKLKPESEEQLIKRFHQLVGYN